MIWSIEITEIFEHNFNKLIPKNLQDSLKKQIFKLKENPYVGKPLGYRYFREKKIKKWRIYYLIYESRLVIYFIDVSDKKSQQIVIDKIKEKLKELND
jgi:mRNA-degrading endonuclease RelE of RelBE toxin-antitoxin system